MESSTEGGRGLAVARVAAIVLAVAGLGAVVVWAQWGANRAAPGPEPLPVEPAQPAGAGPDARRALPATAPAGEPAGSVAEPPTADPAGRRPPQAGEAPAKERRPPAPVFLPSSKFGKFPEPPPAVFLPSTKAGPVPHPPVRRQVAPQAPVQPPVVPRKKVFLPSTKAGGMPFPPVQPPVVPQAPVPAPQAQQPGNPRP